MQSRTSRGGRPVLLRTIRIHPEEVESARFCSAYRRKNVEKTEGGSGFVAVSSTTTRLAVLRQWPDPLAGADLVKSGLEISACSSTLIARRRPSNPAVWQRRLFSIMPAQIFAAAAASLSGPATSRSCMPSPLLPSLTTIIGRSVVNAAFDLDFRSPSHRARNPGSEFAPPTSTPNSVRWMASLGAVTADASGSTFSTAGAEATMSGLGVADTVFAALSDSINFAAAPSGGAMIDLAATSGADGTGAAILDVFCAADETARACSGAAVSVAAFSGVFATAAATGDKPGAGVGFNPAAGCGSVIAITGTGCDAGAARLCLAIAPVTESRPCSNTVTREYSRSRSPLSVSIADARRRFSFWISLASEVICWACWARSTAATCSRRKPIQNWLA